MRTSRSISCVSYNSEDFLINRLNEWLSGGVIRYWHFIEHKGEPVKEISQLLKEFPNDKNLKELVTINGSMHKHVWILPNGVLDTDELEEQLIEFVPDNVLPLRCTSFRYSDQMNSILYFAHNPVYLASKGMVRKYQYSWGDFVTSSPITFSQLIEECFTLGDFAYEKSIRDTLSHAEDILEVSESMVLNGYIPMNKANGFYYMRKIIMENRSRNFYNENGGE